MKYAFGIFILLPILLFFPLFITTNYELWYMALFIDAPTLFAFLITMAGVIVVTREFKTSIRTANALFSKKYKISAEDKERGIRLLGLMKKTLICATVFFMIGTLIIMLAGFDDLAHIGPMISILLLTPLYAAIIILIFINPAIYILKTRQNAEEKPAAINERQVVNKMLELCYKQGISPEDIINANEISFKN
jgi:hypothetical protein